MTAPVEKAASLPTDKTFFQQRQEARMPAVNHEKSGTIVAWDPRLAFDVALAGADKAMEVFARYKIDPGAAVNLIQNPVFQQQLKRYAQEIEEGGLTFRQKAKILAEDLLPHAYDLATDVTYPAAVRADMIQWMAKVADLEPVKSNGKDITGHGGFSLQILFAGQAPGMAGQTVVGSSSAVPIEGDTP